MAQAGQRYVSSELAHFVGRGLNAEQQYSLFLKILNEGWITHPPHNPNISGNLFVNPKFQFSSNEMYTPEIVCFCDIPIADLGIHIAKYSPFGLSFSKDFIIQQGGCPVFYLPQQSTVLTQKDLPQDEELRLPQEGGVEALYENAGKGQYFDRMMQEYHELIDMFRELIMQNSKTPGVPIEHRRLMELERFFSFHIFSHIKFYDHSYADEHDDNYYLEREWRVIGNVKFDLSDIETIFMPKHYAQRFRADCPAYSSQLVFN